MLFVKVSNDGFALGAQRRTIDQDDLPQAERALASFFANPAEFEGCELAQAVDRARISENGEWNLSNERYLVTQRRDSQFDLLPFSEVCTLEYGASLPKDKRIEGPYPVIGSNGVTGFHNEFLIRGPAIIVGRKGSAGEVTYIPEDCFPIDTTYYVQPKDPSKVDLVYLFHLLRSLNLIELKGGAGIPGLNRNDVYEKHLLPLPPLNIQREIVSEIEGYQKIIDGARQVVENYRPYIAAKAEWPMQSISEIAEINPRKSQLIINDESMLVSFVPMADLQEHEMFFQAKESEQIGNVFKQYTYFQNNDVLLAKVTPCFENGKAGIARNLINGIGFGSSEYYVIRADQQLVLPEWIYLHIATPEFRAHGAIRMTGTGGLQRVPRDVLAEWKIPVPQNIEEQRTLIEAVEAEQALINANKELIACFEAKIKAVIDKVWVD
ncbi:restriction endonuclease subunit S [Pseudomonas sp. PDM14]|uniref:restriction endonuclease subunit S n=1 Tax=Pseudomonas sp. PDM14 TaxID=2769288 RepID=UPI00298C4C34|nr:restriction endonuclease subunit S [Pseudomonas sp. PDM14]